MKKLLSIVIAAFFVMSMAAMVACSKTEKIEVEDAIAALSKVEMVDEDWSGIRMDMNMSYGDHNVILTMKMIQDEENPQYLVEGRASGMQSEIGLYYTDGYTYMNVKGMGNDMKVKGQGESPFPMDDFVIGDESTGIVGYEGEAFVSAKKTTRSGGVVIYELKFDKDMMSQAMSNIGVMGEILGQSIEIPSTDVGELTMKVYLKNKAVTKLILEGEVKLMVQGEEMTYKLRYSIEQFSGSIDFPDFSDYQEQSGIFD